MPIMLANYISSWHIFFTDAFIIIANVWTEICREICKMLSLIIIVPRYLIIIYLYASFDEEIRPCLIYSYRIYS